MNWSNNDLINELSKRVSHGTLLMWRLFYTELNREERYFIQDPKEKVALDQVRSVSDERFQLQIWVPKGERQGTVSIPLFRSQDFMAQLDKAQNLATLSSEEKWGFSVKKLETSKAAFKTIYEPIEKDLKKTTDRLADEFKKAIIETPKGQFNSAELFTWKECQTTYLSTGLNWENKKSKIYAEVCFSEKDSSGEENEYLLYKMGAHPEEINFKALCEESSTYAAAILKASGAPSSGSYPVVVSSDVIGPVFVDVLTQLKADNRYYEMPHINQGDTFIEGFEGEEFSLLLDPHLDYGFGSSNYSSDGALLKKTELISKNTVQSNLVSDKLAQYLKCEPTTNAGNIIIQTQGQNYESLLKLDKPVIEVLQFSALFTNWQDLTFSSEIRLGKVHEPSGKSYYFKGGSLSGQFKENFKNVMFSKETIFENLNELSMSDLPPMAYKGPRWARLSDVSISS